MEKILLRQLHPSNVISVQGNQDVAITSVTFDSRKACPGCLFVALPGSNVDGAAFIDDAIKRGAAAVVTQNSIENLNMPVIRVTDARQALSEIAKIFFDDPTSKMQVIGVTGTKGKTTTTYLVQSILRQVHGQAFRIGSVEHDLGFETKPARNTTPESLDIVSMLASALKNGVKAGVMEVSSHALKTWRVEDLTFAAAGFTNLSLEHTEFHPTMEDYYQAKRRLFLELLPRGHPAVIAVDDEYGRRLAEDCRKAGVQFKTISMNSENSDADFKVVDNVSNRDGKQKFTLKAPDQQIALEISLVGKFNIFNSMMATALCRSIGVPWTAITAGLASVVTVPGRFESIPNNKGLTVIVDYAHAPAALQNVLSAARQLTTGRLLTVFGCGGNRSREKRPVMGRIAAAMSDITIVTSDNPRKERPEDIIAEIMSGINSLSANERGEVHVEVDRRKAIALAISLARPGDLILIAGKGHETGQTFADRTIPFDDREVAREYLQGVSNAYNA